MKKSEVAAASDSQHKPEVPLVQVDKALESLRASNYNTSAAVGEPLDNALDKIRDAIPA